MQGNRTTPSFYKVALSPGGHCTSRVPANCAVGGRKLSSDNAVYHNALHYKTVWIVDFPSPKLRKNEEV